MKKGFTLMEIVVVILIIGVLAAVAFPFYEKALDKSRFSRLMPPTKSIAAAQERVYQSKARYSGSLQALDVKMPVKAYSEGGKQALNGEEEFELNLSGDRSFITAGNPKKLKNKYILYFQNSENFPGEAHCQALKGERRSNELCEEMGGTLLGDAGDKTVYVLEGKGNGFLTSPGQTVVKQTTGRCTGSSATCTITEYADGSRTEMRVSGDYKYLNVYGPDGKLSAAVEYYKDGLRSVSEYDPETGKIARKYEYAGTTNPPGYPSSVYEYNANGTLASRTDYKDSYYDGRRRFEYDENGKLVSQTDYRSDGSAMYQYKYDAATGKWLEHYQYESDGKGGTYLRREVETSAPGRYLSETYFDSNGNVTERKNYDPVTGKEQNVVLYDSKGNVTAISQSNANGEKTSLTYYDSLGRVTLSSEQDPVTGTLTSQISYRSDGVPYEVMRKEPGGGFQRGGSSVSGFITGAVLYKYDVATDTWTRNDGRGNITTITSAEAGFKTRDESGVLSRDQMNYKTPSELGYPNGKTDYAKPNGFDSYPPVTNYPNGQKDYLSPDKINYENGVYKD